MPKGTSTRVPWNKGKRFCPMNHDTLEVGRTLSGGCRVCARASQSRCAWSIAGQIRRWGAHLRNQYGMTLKDWTKLVLASNGRCEACGTTFRSDTHCHIDHNHTTRQVRGLLCQGCNIKLAAIESKEYNAIKNYLKIK